MADLDDKREPEKERGTFCASASQHVGVADVSYGSCMDGARDARGI